MLAAISMAAAMLATSPPGAPAQGPSRPALEDFGKLPAVEAVSLSPDGQYLAFVTVAHDVREAVVRPIAGPGGFVMGVGRMKVRTVDWLPGDHVLVEASETLHRDPSRQAFANGEFMQSAIMDAHSGRIFTVFGAQRSKILASTQGLYGHSASAGKSFAYFGGVTLETSGSGFVDFSANRGTLSHGHADLYRVDLASGAPEKIAGGSELHGTDWLVGADGQVEAHAEYDRYGVWRLFKGPADGTLVAEISAPTGDVALLGAGRTPGTVLVFQPIGPDGRWVYMEYPLSRAGTPSPMFAGLQVRELVRSFSTNLLIGAVTEDDEPRTLLFDPALQNRFDAVRRALPGERVSLVSATDDMNRMVLLAEGPDDSGTWFLVDYATHKIDAVAWRYPSIGQGAVGEVRVVPYKAADGLAMQGVLTLPPGRAPRGLPLVVLPHGGPEARDYRAFDWWAQAFASRGYAVFQPNFRGSSGFGAEFRNAGFGEWGRKMQTDISDGVAELARQGLVNPRRACIVGASYGGYAALAGVTIQQGLYRCAVSVGGVADLNALLSVDADRMGDRSAGMRYMRRFLGVTGEGSPGLDALSPRRLARRADAPILLVWGKDDSVVPIDQSRDLAAALKAAGKPVETVVLEDEDHWLSREPTRIRMLQASVAFVQRHNPVD